MEPITCLIGVVSYEGSRFAVSQGPDGLAARLASHFSADGIAAAIQVNTLNLWDSRHVDINRNLVQRSLSAENAVKNRWERYLHGGDHVPTSQRAARWGLRQWQRLRSPGPGSIRRLVNIELSHIDLMKAAIRQGTDWLLLLEDDASSADIHDCADGLASIMRQAPMNVCYINVSQSFSPQQLGIAHLLQPSEEKWSGGIPRQICSASLPVTNTVCAILYRREFLQNLLDELESIPLLPAIPIDWKLNAALMAMTKRGDLGSSSCWQVVPAPIDQLSFHQDHA